MKLRNLQLNDAVLMYEWMTDSDVNKYFSFDPSKVTLASCEEFIKSSFTDTNKHYAIEVDNEYAGTISLKNIDYKNMNAEYAISLRKKYRGKGYGEKASIELLKIAFENLELNKVYLNALSDNICAIKLYEKIGFVYEGELKKHIKIKGEYRDLKLYGIWRSDYEQRYKND